MLALRLQICKAVLAAVLLHLLFLVIYVAKHHGDVSCLLCCANDRVGRPPFEVVTARCGPGGHDGQQCYALARDPWRLPHDDLDCAAAMRHLRILYPAVCWLCSNGQPRLLIYVMPAVNLAAIAVLTWLGSILALHYSRSASWGFLLPLALNMGLPLLHDFTDCLSTLAVFGLLTSWLTGGSWWAMGLWGAAAVLSREQNIAVVGIVGVAGLWARRPAVFAGAAAALAIWLGWFFLVSQGYGRPPYGLSAGGHLGAPFAGMAYRWTHLGGDNHFSRRLAILTGISMAHLTLLLPLSLYVIWRRPGAFVSLLLLAGCTSAILGSRLVYEFWTYARVFVWLPIGIWISAFEVDGMWLLWTLAPASLWPVFIALNYM